MAPAGSAVLPYEISDAEYDSTSNRIVFVSRRPEIFGDLPYANPRDTLVEVFDATTFGHDKTVTLPRFQRQGSPLLMHGQFVFERSDGTTYYAVVKSEPIAGVEKDRAFGVVRLAP